jgi:hypothetical protein
LAVFGAPDTIRTCDLCLRRATLYPAELRVLGHRYLPEQPHEPGNPVFSVYQADVIYYGADLIDYFEREFAGWGHRPWPDQIRYIPFWSDLVARNI